MHASTPLRRLRRDWAVYLAASAVFVLIGYLTLAAGWEMKYAQRWLVVTAGLVAYQYGYLYRHLDDNRLKDIAGAPLFPDLGLANGLTTVRSVFTASLAGFLLSPWPGGWLAWVPSVLYLTSAVMDFLDGYVARITGRTTVLGEDLDMQWDSTGMLFGTALSVFYGQTPFPYLLVGLARYLYLFGLWVRKKRGLPIYDLPHNPFRRALAGAQMGFVAVVLMPVFGPPVTRLVAVLFMLPLLIGFLRDYLWVTGRLSLPVQGGRAPAWRETMGIFLPLALRGMLSGLLLYLMVRQLQQPEPDWAVVVTAGLAVLPVGLGAAGRMAALVVLILSAFGLRTEPFAWHYWGTMICSFLLFMTGTGRYSIWKPEDWLIYRRAGERTARQ